MLRRAGRRPRRLADLIQATVGKILDGHAVKLPKLGYPLARRDPEFEKNWRKSCAFAKRSGS
jgi:hypothetical protein